MSTILREGHAAGDPVLELIQVETGLLVEVAADGDGELFDDEFAGAVDSGAQQMSADASVVPPAGGDMKVKIWPSVLFGNIARQVGDLHLLGKGLVHILFCCRVQEAECGFANGAEPADAAGKDMFFLTEGRQRLCDFDMVPKAQDIFSSGDFLIAVHSLSYTTEIYD